MADPIQRLIQQLARLPGIGERTAARLAFHLVCVPAPQVRELADALVWLIERVRLCSVCANVTELDPCAICSDKRRDTSSICVVATPADVAAIERGGHFRGMYHVLHGVLSPLDGIGPEDLQIDTLIARIRTGALSAAEHAPPQFDEIIIATSANVEGEATAMFLARLIKPLGVKVTRIASGIPVGGELEYSDQATIARAMAQRTAM